MPSLNEFTSPKDFIRRFENALNCGADEMRELIRFVFVGVLNTFFGYFLYAVLLTLGFGFGLALTIGTAIGVAFNFKTTGVLVFGSRDNSLFFRFIGVYLMVYCLNFLGLWALDLIGFDPFTSGLFILVPMAAVAYVLNKCFVFKVNQ